MRRDDDNILWLQVARIWEEFNECSHPTSFKLSARERNMAEGLLCLHTLRRIRLEIAMLPHKQEATRIREDMVLYVRQSVASKYKLPIMGDIQGVSSWYKTEDLEARMGL